MSRFSNLEFEQPEDLRLAAETAVSDGRQQLLRAEESLRRGDFEAALRAYGRAIEFDAGLPAAWAGQVRMLIELGEFDEAAAWADRGLERFPEEPEVLAAKAVCLARGGDTQAALTFSDAAIEEGGRSAYVWLARGDVLLARGERRAEYCFNRALGAGAGDWLWLWLASRVHYYYRRFSTALKLITQALALDGNFAAVWAHLGRCQTALGLPALAVQSLAQARELDSGCPEIERLNRDLRDNGPGNRWAGVLRRWLGR